MSLLGSESLLLHDDDDNAGQQPWAEQEFASLLSQIGKRHAETVCALAEKLRERDREIAQLRAQLSQLHRQVDDLKLAGQQQRQAHARLQSDHAAELERLSQQLASLLRFRADVLDAASRSGDASPPPHAVDTSPSRLALVASTPPASPADSHRSLNVLPFSLDFDAHLPPSPSPPRSPNRTVDAPASAALLVDLDLPQTTPVRATLSRSFSAKDRTPLQPNPAVNPSFSAPSSPPTDYQPAASFDRERAFFDEARRCLKDDQYTELLALVKEHTTRQLLEPHAGQQPTLERLRSLLGPDNDHLYFWFNRLLVRAIK